MAGARKEKEMDNLSKIDSFGFVLSLEALLKAGKVDEAIGILDKLIKETESKSSND